MSGAVETDVTITYLEMQARPAYDRPSVPPGPPTALMRATDPPVWYFLALYRAVGERYHWTDRFSEDPRSLAAFVQHPEVHLYTLMRAGWPAGFFQLDGRQEAECELSYFGLVPEAIGKGLGTYLLQTAVHLAWDRPGVKCVKVETCTLDHPRALGLYQKVGFMPVGQRTVTRSLQSPAGTPEETDA